MNYTTEDYLNQLESDRSDMVDNLETKGITGLTGDETFTELVPEILNITGGGGATLQSKSVAIVNNGTTNVVPDSGYDGLSAVEISTNVVPVSNVYRVETIAQRNALTGVNDGDICIVANISRGNWEETTNSSNITFPETVILPYAYSGWFSCMLTADQSSGVYFDGQIQLYQQQFRLQGWGDTVDVSVEYSSYDGITYTRQMINAEDTSTGDSLVDGDTINLPFNVYVDGDWTDELGYFMQTGSETFDGLFTYKDNSWVYTNIGVNEDGSNYLTGYKGYTNSGLTTGVFPQGTKRDLNFIVNNRYGSFKVDDCKYLFADVYSNLTELGFSLDTSDCTDMESMFRGCSKLTELDLSNLNTTNVESTIEMFDYCTGLKSINLSNWDFTNLKNCNGMFYYCSSLTDVDFSNVLPANKIKRANHIICGCSSLKSIDLSFINNLMGDYENPNQNEILLHNMFSNCSALENVDLRNMNFDYAYTQNSKVLTTGMFSNCTSMKKIDMRSFTFDKVYTHTNMFGTSASAGVPNNCLIIVKDATQKSWLNTNYSRLTNVKTVAEYEASLNS